MPKIDLFQCDNKQCPDESETRDWEEAGWILVDKRDSGSHWFFCSTKCMKAWVNDTYQDE